MDRASAARALTRRARTAGRAPAARGASRFTVAIAGRDDDPEIRRLLRDTVLPGQVRLTLERDPDSFAAGRIEGDQHAFLVARERATGRLAAIASRSSRPRFVNGSPARVGYLGGLRIAAGFGGSHELLEEGFTWCRRLHDRDPADIYLASVVAGHPAARRRLERGGPGWPAFAPVDELVTMAIPARRGAWRGRESRRVEIVSGARVAPAQIAGVLARHNRRYQFAPCWTAGDLATEARVPGLRPGDFLVALRGGSVVGCAALWDQRAFKQVVVRGYSRSLARWRPAINMLGYLSGVPGLPPAGSALAFAHLSHFAVEDDESGVAVDLTRAARRAARAAGLDYVALGLSSRSPLYEAVRRACVHRSYRSVLYAGCWPEGRAALDGIDGRPSHPDTSVL